MPSAGALARCALEEVGMIALLRDFGMSLNMLRGKTEAVLALVDEEQRAARDCGASDRRGER